MMQSLTPNSVPNNELDSLAIFKKAMDGMVASNAAFDESGSRQQMRKNTGYDTEAIEELLETLQTGSDDAKRQLSCQFFSTNGYYKQIIIHYATLLDYAGILIPRLSSQTSLQDKKTSKRYMEANETLANMNIRHLCEYISFVVLRDGAFYGAICHPGKSNSFALMELPYKYCRTRFFDEYGNALVEFDVSYFDQLKRASRGKDDYGIEEILSSFPDVISKHYKKYLNAKNKPSKWVLLPSSIGIAFFLFDKSPHFLNSVPAIIQYEQSVVNEQDRQENEISKILCNTVPHTSDGKYMLEPTEAEQFHNGVVRMVTPKNKHMSVLTTFTDTEILNSGAKENVSNDTLDNMRSSLYAAAGVSSEIFNASGSSSIPYSLNGDIDLMMVLAKKMAMFIGSYITHEHGNNNLSFTYQFLPVATHNRDKFIDSSFKLASSGYSFLVPAVAQGLSQQELVDIKHLEKDYLQLDKLLTPLSSAYTQSKGSAKEEAKDPKEKGRPSLDPGEETEKTAQNKKSKEKTGGQ